MRVAKRGICVISARSVAVTLLVSACTPAAPEQAAKAAPEQGAKAQTWIAPAESIVVLESPQFVFSWEHERHKMGVDVNACAARSIVEKHPTVRVISQGEFVRAAFPDLPPDNAPVSPESMKLLAESDVLRERIAPLNIRYLVYAGAATEIRNLKQGAAVFGGGPAGGFIVTATWDQQSDYSLAVVDVKTGRDARSEGTVAGHGWFFAGLIIIPLVAGSAPATESQACRDLGARVLATLESVGPRPTSEPQ